jgi:hypothetical protein
MGPVLQVLIHWIIGKWPTACFHGETNDMIWRPPTTAVHYASVNGRQDEASKYLLEGKILQEGKSDVEIIRVSGPVFRNFDWRSEYSQERRHNEGIECLN